MINTNPSLKGIARAKKVIALMLRHVFVRMTII